MASCITPEWVATSPRVKMTVTQTASTSTQVTLSWKVEYISSSPAYTNNFGRPYDVTINGVQVKNGTYNINNVTGTNLIANGTVNISKGTSSKSIPFSINFNFALQWSGVAAAVKSASGSISIDARDSYTVKYDANGGTGAPNAQTKWAGTTLKLSTVNPKKTGHTFLGWSTNSTATTETYKSGGLFTANKSVTLYAIYKANTYTVKYDANGGTGAPNAQTKTYGKTLVLSKVIPVKTNYVFMGWGTSSSSSTVVYKAGDNYVKNTSITLYGIWKIGYKKPKINNLVVERCLENGVLDEFGTYILVKCNWETEKTVTSIKVEYKSSASQVYENSKIITASGTKGSIEEIIGSGDFSIELSYNVRITVADASGNTAVIKNVAQTHYDIDLLGGGGGVAFGKPAEINGVDFGMPIILRNGININIMTWSNDELLMIGSNEINQFFFGYGSYAKRIGITYLDGNNVSIRSRNGIDLIANNVNIQGRAYGSQKILWSGGLYMTAGHTATLSDSISKQPNGISLIFSQYRNNEVQNYQFQSFFVPKQQIKAHEGCGHTFLLTDDGNFEIMACKYLYIHDTKIVGKDYNGLEETKGTCGITFNNHLYVLRYVIGF